MRNRRIETRSEMALVGIEARTTNEAEQQGGDSARIPGLWSTLFSTGVPDRVAHKSGAGELIEMYTDYANDETGEYTIFLGYEVERVADDLAADLVVRTVPAGRYLVFTSERGPVVPAVQEAWRRVWSSSPEELGAERSFVADFEVFGAGSKDFEDGEVDIYLSIR